MYYIIYGLCPHMPALPPENNNRPTSQSRSPQRELRPLLKESAICDRVSSHDEHMGICGWLARLGGLELELSR